MKKKIKNQCETKQVNKPTINERTKPRVMELRRKNKDEFINGALDG